VVNFEIKSLQTAVLQASRVTLTRDFRVRKVFEPIGLLLDLKGWQQIFYEPFAPALTVS
jgi:hypothetical protein